MIFYFINCVSETNTPNGGHYVSLLHLTTELEKLGARFRIVVFGDMFPVPLKGTGAKLYPMTPDGAAQFLRESAAELETANIFHAFSEASAKWIAPVVARFRKPIVVTKPGKAAAGLRKHRYRNMVYFQSAEYEVERRLAKHSWTGYNPALIPNRISPDLLRGAGRTTPFTGQDAIRILRIGRINHNYNRIVAQAVNLLRLLTETGARAELAVVGVVEEAAAHVELLRRNWPDVSIHVSPEFTDRASELIDFADIVVGVGRSAMEAIALQKPTFVAGTDPELPIFLDELSFGQAFANNFSLRTPAVGACEPRAAFQRFLAVRASPEETRRHADFLASVAERHFDAAAGARALLDYYATCKPEPTAFLQAADAVYREFSVRTRRKLRKILGGAMREPAG